MCLNQTCQQKEIKKSENFGSPIEACKASRVTQLGVWGGAVSTPNFLTILTAQRNSGASGEVNYRYLKFISCNFFLKLFYILILN